MSQPCPLGASDKTVEAVTYFLTLYVTQKLERSIIKTASKDWNSLPKELRGLEKKKTFPKELKKFYIKSFFDNKQYTTYGSVSWKSIRF